MINVGRILQPIYHTFRSGVVASSLSNRSRSVVPTSRARSTLLGPVCAMVDVSASPEDMIPSFKTWIDRCNDGLSCLDSGEYTPFAVGEVVVGYIERGFVDAHLGRFPDVFHVTSNRVDLSSSLRDESVENRSKAVGGCLEILRDEGVITGWRNELYPVLTTFHSEPVLLIERAASVYFGVKAYGVHVNGYVIKENGQKEMWVARRSKHKPTWPGKLDHIVAGGQPYGLSPMENVIKECEEEAGIDGSIASQAVAVGAVSYCSKQSQGLKRDVLFCYDLRLPDDFVPTVNDGEVEEFYRMPIEQVLQIVSKTDGDTYKDNCNLVVLDFMMRHGYITPEVPGYLDILSGVRRADLS